MSWRNMKSVLATATALMLIVSVCPLAAQSEEERPVLQKRAIPPLIEDLGLTAQQKDKIREQQYEERKKKMEVRNNVRLKELDLQHELGAPKPNKETINKLVGELKELQGQLLQLRVDAILKLRDILTDNQYEKFKAFGVDIMKARLRGIGAGERERKKEKK